MARKGKTRAKPAPERWLVTAQQTALGLGGSTPPAEPVPVCQRSEVEEEAWWEAVAADMGMTLQEFDIRCGLVDPAAVDEAS